MSKEKYQALADIGFYPKEEGRDCPCCDEVYELRDKVALAIRALNYIGDEMAPQTIKDLQAGDKPEILERIRNFALSSAADLAGEYE